MVTLLYFTSVLYYVRHLCTVICTQISSFYSPRNARIASAVLATAIPSVRPSVTRRYCVKTTACSTVHFAPLDSKMCLVLLETKTYSPGSTRSP